MRNPVLDSYPVGFAIVLGVMLMGVRPVAAQDCGDGPENWDDIQGFRRCVQEHGLDFWTPWAPWVLHDAARLTGNPAIVQVLLQAGADPNAVDDNGLAALHHGARNTNPVVVFSSPGCRCKPERPGQRGLYPAPLGSRTERKREGRCASPGRGRQSAGREQRWPHAPAFRATLFRRPKRNLSARPSGRRRELDTAPTRSTAGRLGRGSVVAGRRSGSERGGCLLAGAPCILQLRWVHWRSSPLCSKRKRIRTRERKAVRPVFSWRPPRTTTLRSCWPSWTQARIRRRGPTPERVPWISQEPTTP